MTFTKSITVYNSHEQDFKKILLPTLLKGVHAEVTKGTGHTADGDNNADKLLVIIPFNSNRGYALPQAYESTEDKSGIWTLTTGDIITVGDTGAAEDFAELSARAEVFRITEIKRFDFGGLPHWEVTAR
ncbi:MAG: hypothetical protein IJZ95_07295 [Oscillospiraceae bacterium]|nr:hypothetical protein [Oscillospiraceae bacterium]